jgi:hypothetical protein
MISSDSYNDTFTIEIIKKSIIFIKKKLIIKYKNILHPESYFLNLMNY